MNINLKFLFLGTTLSLIPQYTAAQCSPAQSCAELGYKETANKGGCLKCPFGNGWYCPEPKEEKAVLGECTGYAKNCKIGNILNSDGTCTSDKVSGKTPIGVVVYIGDDNCGQAMAMQDLGNIRWSNEEVDIPNLTNYNSESNVAKDFNSCGNTQKIIKFGDASQYPAAWAAVNYAPDEAPATKGKWCLPAAGVALAMNKHYDKVNSELITNNWKHSSSEFNNAQTWRWNEIGLQPTLKLWNFAVHPVITF